MKTWISTMVCALFVLLAGPAWAHRPSDAHLHLTADGESLRGRIELAVTDLDAAIGVDANGDGDITWAELKHAQPRIHGYLSERLGVSARGTPCALDFGPGKIAKGSIAYWSAEATVTCASAISELVVDYRVLFDLDAQHRGLLTIAGQTLIVRDATPQRVTIGETTVWRSFVKEGVWHIWIGLDHILFLFCLLLPAIGTSRVREVLEIVTAFTLAHSITLVLSAAGIVQLPARFIEIAIAISVGAAAVNNLVRWVDARWAVAFALGLLHGFGFSNVLLDVGLPTKDLINALLAFNVGVEIGQAVIVVALFGAFALIKRSTQSARIFRGLLWGGSVATACVASLWTFQRWVA